MNNQSTTPFNLETTLENLEEITTSMEKDTSMGVEAAFSKYEEGIQLVRQCQTALQKMQQKIQIVSEKKEGHGEFVLTDFAPDSKENDT